MDPRAPRGAAHDRGPDADPHHRGADADALARRVDAKVAMDLATFMAPMWRLAGNPAFEQSQQQIFDRLAAARPVKAGRWTREELYEDGR